MNARLPERVQRRQARLRNDGNKHIVDDKGVFGEQFLPFSTEAFRELQDAPLDWLNG